MMKTIELPNLTGPKPGFFMEPSKGADIEVHHLSARWVHLQELGAAVPALFVYYKKPGLPAELLFADYFFLN